MATTLLIDADVLAFQAAAAAEHPLCWGDGLWTLHSWEEDVIAHFEDALWTLKEDLDSDHEVFALSSARNFRKDVLPTYKGNRKATRKPMLLDFIKDYIRQNFETREIEGLEGDDVLGILVTSEFTGGIVVSIDKDMLTLPGRHYNPNWKTPETEDPRQLIRTVSKDEADRWHLMQTLAGDTTDGYSGCPGVGMGTAEKVLDNPRRLKEEEKTVTRGKNKGEVRKSWVDDGPAESLWEAVVHQFAKAGLTEPDALQQARVARILRSSDFNSTTQEPILWQPHN